MNLTLSLQDYNALSPLLTLLFGALLLLLVESFSPVLGKRGSFFLAAATFICALFAASIAPESVNPELTPWVKFDSLSKIFTLFFLSVGLATTFLAHAFLKRFPVSEGEYYFLLLSSVFGLILIGSSADFLTLFIGLETLSIALYVLCGYMKHWSVSHEAAMKYFLMGALGTAFLLYGIALIYGAFGTTRFDLLHASSSPLFLSGIALVTVGFAFKAALVPFHTWAPDVYCGAPTPVTAFMAVGTKVGAFAAFIRLFSTAHPLWSEALSALAIATLIYANFVALRQSQLRRFFAYSGISHAGFMLIPLVSATPDALPALLFYMVVYAIATLGSFAVLAHLDETEEGATLSKLTGFFYRAPYLAALFALCLLTLAGIPPTIGFFAKFFILKGAFEAGYTLLAVVGLLTAILSAYYYLRIVSLMLQPAPGEAKIAALWPAGAVAAFSFALLLLYSFYPAPLLDRLILLNG